MPATKTVPAMQPDKAADLLETMLLSPEAADPDGDSVAVSWDFLRALQSWITLLESGR